MASIPKLTGANIKRTKSQSNLVMHLATSVGKSNLPEKKAAVSKVYRTVFDVANVAIIAADVGKVVYRYANGNINKVECVEQLGEKGACYASSFAASKSGTMVGGAIGSAVGSVVPGVGTVVGLTVGAVAGEIVGDAVGYKAGKEISKIVTKTVKEKKNL